MKKKLQCLLMSLAMVLCLCQVPEIQANAANNRGNELIEVVREDAPLRVGPSNKDDIVARTTQGRVLLVKRSLVNSKGNLWYEVFWEDSLNDGKTLYIYSGNVEKHDHHYETSRAGFTKFNYCNCGQIQLIRDSRLLKSCGVALPSVLPIAGAISLADGPLPVGDIIAGLSLIAVTAIANNITLSEDVVEIAHDVNIVDWLRDEGSVCTQDNYRAVVRSEKKLKIVSELCMSAEMAFIFSRYGNIDVWTPDQTGEAALNVVKYSQDGFFGPEVDENKTGYYYHYHYGTGHDNKVGGHVFFGNGVGNGCVPERA